MLHPTRFNYHEHFQLAKLVCSWAVAARCHVLAVDLNFWEILRDANREPFASLGWLFRADSETSPLNCSYQIGFYLKYSKKLPMFRRWRIDSGLSHHRRSFEFPTQLLSCKQPLCNQYETFHQTNYLDLGEKAFAIPITSYTYDSLVRILLPLNRSADTRSTRSRLQQHMTVLAEIRSSDKFTSSQNPFWTFFLPHWTMAWNLTQSRTDLPNAQAQIFLRGLSVGYSIRDALIWSVARHFRRSFSGSNGYFETPADSIFMPLAIDCTLRDEDSSSSSYGTVLLQDLHLSSRYDFLHQPRLIDVEVAKDYRDRKRCSFVSKLRPPSVPNGDQNEVFVPWRLFSGLGERAFMMIQPVAKLREVYGMTTGRIQPIKYLEVAQSFLRARAVLMKTWSSAYTAITPHHHAIYRLWL